MGHNKQFSIVFMGTPDFAVSSLEEIYKSGINIAGVITAPDKPAGRGKKLQSSAVKNFALNNNIEPILQPTNLKDSEFQDTLKALNVDLFVVVAFRMLPESVWNMPEYGTINLHASLLPNYRGAAPINWAVINGENKTGVSTFFIEKEIDTGKVIKQHEVAIEKTDTAGSIHDKLMISGATLLRETIQDIFAGKANAIAQDSINISECKSAPKIFKEDCKINWNQPVDSVYNLIRGLSPYPAAWTELTASGTNPVSYKIFEASIGQEISKPEKPGKLIFKDKSQLLISCTDGYLNILSLQQAGKKRMDIESFLRGFNESDKYNLAT